MWVTLLWSMANLRLSMKSYSPYLIAGHAAFVVFAFLAVWFAEERVLLIDSAYQLFHDINHESILINDNRFSMVLSQLLPWLLIKLHVPLRWLIVAYSASFVMLAYGCFLLTSYVLRQPRVAAVMVLTFLGMCSTFFHCISETFQLMFFAPMLYALAQYKLHNPHHRFLYWSALILAEAVTFFIHPVAIFFILYIIGLRVLECNRLRIDATSIVLFVTLAAFATLRMLLGQSGHDESFVPTADTLRHALSHFFSLDSFGFFRTWFLIYLCPIVLWALTLVGYFRQRLWLRLAFVGLFFPAFFALSVIVYWQGDGSIGMERTYLPLYFFAGLPFFVDELPRLAGWRRWTVFGYFAVMLVIGFTRISMDIHIYANRLEEIKHIAAYGRDHGQHKLIVTRSTAEQLFRVNIWGLALESMLLTARDGADQTVTIYLEEDDFDRSNDDFYANPDVYMSVNWWKRWLVADLNPHYFSLPPQGYLELVKTEEGYRLAPLR